MDDNENDLEEVMFLSVEEINNLLDRLKKRDKDIVELIIEQNNTLLDAVVDLQWFMKEKGLTSQQFKAWMEEKDLRTYH